jgi:heptaprenyl diphosphate synthase
MLHTLISPEEIEIGAQLLKWTNTYLMGEEEKIKRPYRSQTVCPFVAASVSNNALFMVFHSEITGDQVEPIVKLLVDYINPFITVRDDKGIDCSSKALLVVFPRLRSTNYHSLDVVHELSKDKMVENGLMIGQFHPDCRTSAIHNSAWRGVSVAPYPLIAMRHMVVHDILFLRDRRNWFLHHHDRYGAKYERPNVLGALSAHLLSVYNEAKNEFLGPGSRARHEHMGSKLR